MPLLSDLTNDPDYQSLAQDDPAAAVRVRQKFVSKYNIQESAQQEGGWVHKLFSPEQGGLLPTAGAVTTTGALMATPLAPVAPFIGPFIGAGLGKAAEKYIFDESPSIGDVVKAGISEMNPIPPSAEVGSMLVGPSIASQVAGKVIGPKWKLAGALAGAVAAPFLTHAGYRAFTHPLPLLETAQESLPYALQGAVNEILARGVIAPATRGVLSIMLPNRLTPAVLEKVMSATGATREQVLDAARQEGFNLSAAQQIGSRGIQMVERMLMRLVGGGRLSAMIEEQPRHMLNRAREVAGEFTPGVKGMSEYKGSQAVRAFERQSAKNMRDVGGKLYEALPQLDPQKEYRTPTLDRILGVVREETVLEGGKAAVAAKKIAPIGQETTEIPELLQPGGRIPPAERQAYLDRLREMGLGEGEGGRTLSQLSTIYRYLNTIFPSSGSDVEVARLQSIREAVLRDITDIAGSDPQARPFVQQFNKARTFYRTEVGEYHGQKEFPRTLAEQENVGGIIDTLSGKIAANDVGAVRQLQESLGQPFEPSNRQLAQRYGVSLPPNKIDRWSVVMREWWNKLTDEAIDKKTGQFSIGKFVDRYFSLTPEMREQLFNGLEPGKGSALRQRVDRLMSVGQYLTAGGEINTKPYPAIGQLMWGMTTGLAAIAGPLTGHSVALGALSISLFSPVILGRMLSSSTIINLLARGLSMAPSDEGYGRMAARLAALLGTTPAMLLSGAYGAAPPAAESYPLPTTPVPIETANVSPEANAPLPLSTAKEQEAAAMKRWLLGQ